MNEWLVSHLGISCIHLRSGKLLPRFVAVSERAIERSDSRVLAHWATRSLNEHHFLTSWPRRGIRKGDGVRLELDSVKSGRHDLWHSCTGYPMLSSQDGRRTGHIRFPASQAHLADRPNGETSATGRWVRRGCVKRIEPY